MGRGPWVIGSDLFASIDILRQRFLVSIRWVLVGM